MNQDQLEYTLEMERQREREIRIGKQSEYEELMSTLKPRLNELLFQVLPSETTLGELESLAIQIYDRILQVSAIVIGRRPEE